MSEPIHGPHSFYVNQTTTAKDEVFFLCRSTGKLCSRATEYGSCRSTASSDYICSLYAIEDGTLKSNLGEGL